jgi:hypothetical protein
LTKALIRIEIEHRQEHYDFSTTQEIPSLYEGIIVNMSKDWSTPIDFETVCRHAAGRRHYQAKRQAETRERLKIVLAATFPPEGHKRGTQAELARALDVHRSTICRDVKKWKRTLLEVARLWKEMQNRSQFE